MECRGEGSLVSKPNSPSKLRRRAAEQAAKAAVYASSGAPYDAAINPFPPESPQHRQFAHAYASRRRLFWNCESLLADMREVYGY